MFQAIQRFIKGLIFDGKLKTDEVMHVFVEKGRTRNEGYAQFPD